MLFIGRAGPHVFLFVIGKMFIQFNLFDVQIAIYARIRKHCTVSVYANTTLV